MRRIVATLLGIGLLAAAGASPALAQSEDQVEMQIGQQEYQALQQKGEILQNSPYYSVLNPIAQQIKRVADPQYFHPFQFILVHEAQPNAFAVPGGNVYVTDSLMKFVQNREELAGVLCHETSHDIHHDVLHLYQKAQKANTAYSVGDLLANILTGGRASRAIDTAASIGFSLQTATYSRDVESAADRKGAETCARGGFESVGHGVAVPAVRKSRHRRQHGDALRPPDRPAPHRRPQARVRRESGPVRSLSRRAPRTRRR